MSVRVRVNGEERELPDGASVADLIEALELRPELVAVELNRVIVRREVRALTKLSDGDQVELVTLVGGG